MHPQSVHVEIVRREREVRQIDEGLVGCPDEGRAIGGAKDFGHDAGLQTDIGNALDRPGSISMASNSLSPILRRRFSVGRRILEVKGMSIRV